MVVSACHYTDAAFTQSVPHDGKGGLIGGTLGPLGLLSRSIDCNGTWNNPTTYYDGVALCDDFFFDVGIWGTSFCLVQNNDLVNYGDGSSYLVSCMEIDYNAVNVVTGTSTVETAVSHDYTLVLDLASPWEWIPALDWHSGTGIYPHPKDPAAGLLQGWHDLGGKNGCPIDVTPVDFDEDAKKQQDKEGQAQRLVDELTRCVVDASTLPPGVPVVICEIHCIPNQFGIAFAAALTGSISTEIDGCGINGTATSVAPTPDVVNAGQKQNVHDTKTCTVTVTPGTTGLAGCMQTPDP